MIHIKKLIIICLWASVLGANAQAIDLKKNELYINGKLVGKVENKDAWDTMKFYDLNGILRFMILPKKVDFQNNINYWNLYTHPQTRKTVELLKKHARLFKPKLGESEVMVKYGILSENGFNEDSIQYFFDQDGGRMNSDRDKSEIQRYHEMEKGASVQAEIAKANAKYTDNIYRAGKLEYIKLRIQEGNKVYDIHTGDEVYLGKVTIYENTVDNETIIEFLDKLEMPMARGVVKKYSIDPTPFVMYNGMAFSLKLKSENGYVNSFIPICQELIVRDCNFEGVPVAQNKLYIPTNNERLAAKTMADDKIERETRLASYQQGKLIANNGEVIEGEFLIDGTPKPTGGGIVSTKIDGGKKVYRKYLNEKGKTKEDAYSAEAYKYVIFNKDTFEAVKFKPKSASTDGGVDLGKLMFLKEKERFALKKYGNHKVKIFNFEGDPIILNLATNEAIVGTDFGAVKKMEEISNPCNPKAIVDIKNNRYRVLFDAIILWAQSLENCK
jgi:hypothetical protein